jgi:dTDP-4-amino-4,6-dideoxygalactose transaminase
VSQLDVMQGLLDRGISTRRGVMCAHLEPAYEIEPWACGDPDLNDPDARRLGLVESEAAQSQGLLLPLYAQMTEAEQDEVIAAVGDVVAGVRSSA